MSQLHAAQGCCCFQVRKKSKQGSVRPGKMIQAPDEGFAEIEQGERIGANGPIGAGSSAAVRILSGIQMPEGAETRTGGRTDLPEEPERYGEAVRRILWTADAG